MRQWLPGILTLVVGLGAGSHCMGQDQNDFKPLNDTMERLVFDSIPNDPFSSDETIRKADPNLQELDRVLVRITSFIAPVASLSAPTRSTAPGSSLPSPQSGPTPQAAPMAPTAEAKPTAFAIVMEGRYVVQNQYVYECVPKRGPFGHTHYRWELVCRPTWVLQQFAKAQPSPQSPESEMTILREQVQKLSDAVGLLLGANQPNNQEFVDLLRVATQRDLVRQVYGVTLTANRASLAGVIPRTLPPVVQPNP